MWYILKKHKVVLLLCFLAITIVLSGPKTTRVYGSTTPHLSKTQSSPIIAVQLFGLNFRNLEDFNNLFRTLRDNGVNTVIIRVFQNIPKQRHNSESKSQSGVYFRSKKAPLLRDLLRLACQAAKQNGLDLFAWMTTKHCDWITEDHPEWRDKRYHLDTQQTEYYPRLDICHPHVQVYLKQLFEDLARYPIQGILFQDDLILKHTEGFSDHAVQEYCNDTDLKISARSLYSKTTRMNGKLIVTKYSPAFYTWRKWKIQKILSFLSMLTSNSRRINPDLKFALNCYYETLTAPENARTWYSHDVSSAKDTQIDIFSFMAYHRQIAQETNVHKAVSLKMLGSMTKYAFQVLQDPHKILMKIQVKDWQTQEDIDLSEIKTAIQYIKNVAPVGIAFVPYRKNLPLAEIQKVLAPASVHERGP